MSYLEPDAPAFVELEEKRSRFITFLEPVDSRSAALDFVELLRQRYPDARHHCWAYIVGDPKSATELAFNDDGEPSGTAGKPMLNVLQHREVGNCVAVVVRYFGGTKLGAGGLVRAYSGAVSAVVDSADLSVFVPRDELRLSCDYDQESHLRHLLSGLQAEVVSVQYAQAVILSVSLPASFRSELIEQLSRRGQGRMYVLAEDYLPE